MKAVCHTLLALLAASITVAWAADGTIEASLPTANSQVELPDRVEPVAADQDKELTAKDLENMESDLVEAGGACCVVECHDQFGVCTDDCQGQPNQFDCVKGCKQTLFQCQRGCLAFP